MRLVTYDRGGARRLGAWVEDAVVDLPDAVGHPAFPTTMEALVARNGGTTLEAAADALRQPDHVSAAVVGRPRLLAPLLRPEIPVLLGPGEAFRWPESPAKLEVEAGLACITGRPGRDLSLEEAAHAIFAVTLLVTWTVLGVGGSDHGGDRDGPSDRSSATSMGPWVVTPDELSPGRIPIRVVVDGEVRFEDQLLVSRRSLPGILARASRGAAIAPGEMFGSPPLRHRWTLGEDALRPRSTIAAEAGWLGSIRTKLPGRRPG